MTGCPHPFVLAMVATQRHADFQAEADRDRLGRLAQPNADRRQPWSDLPAVRAVEVVLALLLAALPRT